jgi:hypothetical protein
MKTVDIRKEYVILAFFMIGLLMELVGGCSFLVFVDFDNDHSDLTDDVKLRLVVSGILLIVTGLAIIGASMIAQTRKVNAALKAAQCQVDEFLNERKDLRDRGLCFVVSHECITVLRRKNKEVVVEPAIEVLVDSGSSSAFYSASPNVQPFELADSSELEKV